MRFTTHTLFTITLLFFIFDYFTIHQPLLFIIIALLATCIVDIDHPHSKAGKFFQPFSYIIKWILGHRGALHSILVPICLFFLFKFLGYQEVGIAVLLGYTSHLVMDALTPAGIKLFYPLQYKIRGPIKTGSWAEKLLAILLTITISLKLVFSLL
jgi:inner membrane protein